VSITKARPWLIALAAAATMLVLIGALGNPPTQHSLLDNIDFNSFSGRLRAALSTFSWHLNELGNDFGHVFLANVLMDFAVVVLVFLFVGVVSAGSGSFGRTFLSAWFAVIAATVLSGYVRSSVVNANFVDPTLHGKATAIFFSAASPGASMVFAGVVFGLFAALAAAVVGVLTRRDEVVTAPTSYAPSAYLPAAAETPARDEPTSRREAWSAPPAAAPGPVAEPSPWTKDSSPESDSDDDGDRTTQLPAVDSASRTESETDDQTRELPRTDREP
jgi:hypothetical protein